MTGPGRVKGCGGSNSKSKATPARAPAAKAPASCQIESSPLSLVPERQSSLVQLEATAWM